MPKEAAIPILPMVLPLLPCCNFYATSVTNLTQPAPKMRAPFAFIVSLLLIESSDIMAM
jgi:hypothetical protein